MPHSKTDKTNTAQTPDLFKFAHGSCVAVGAFNMQLIQPSWLIERGILAKDDPLECEINLEQAGLRFRNTNTETQWFVTPTRLEIRASSPDENCGESLAQVLDLLNWTPLRAIGINTQYHASPAIISQLRSFSIEFVEHPISKEYKIVQKLHGILVEKENKAHDLRIDFDGSSVNLHTNTQLIPTGSESNVMACETARAYFAQRKENEELAKQLYGVKFLQ